MTRDTLYHAAREVDTARESASEMETSDRLAVLADQLRSQADRKATPALGTLDRIHTKLRTIETEANEPAVSEALEQARRHILSFLETLDDRGMKQHGGG
ncbi:DUF7553 family protein [Haloarcula nitratireducens]|uniref:DUF7553 family protein n=1 Tax=Haloarcula nitratireducens TaxID=2487749 RepID=UPI003CCBBECF